MRSRVLALAAFTLFSAPASGRVGSLLSAQDIGLEWGTVAPTAKVETLEGKPADLAKYVGKSPVLLEFWATWCANCHELEPTMKAMHKKYGSRMSFVGVAVSVNQSPERVKAYVAKHELPWTQVFDRKGNASGAYDAPATSYVVVLDKSGKVVYTGLGGKQDLEGAIKRALGI
jgi:thiol-disulfide isomerase/thioredoxin